MDEICLRNAFLFYYFYFIVIFILFIFFYLYFNFIIILSNIRKFLKKWPREKKKRGMSPDLWESSSMIKRVLGQPNFSPQTNATQ